MFILIIENESCLTNACLSFVLYIHQSTTAKALLSFVNENTKKKFLITNDLEKVCAELGWDKAAVDECGGVTEFMHQHETDAALMVLPDAAAEVEDTAAVAVAADAAVAAADAVVAAAADNGDAVNGAA